MTSSPHANRSAFPFDPVPLRRRRDGWTPERQFAFIAALRECRSAPEACRRVGLSTASVYKLYRRPDAAAFRTAWDEAIAPVLPPRPSRPDRGPSRAAIARVWREARRARREAFGPWTVTRPTDEAVLAAWKAALFPDSSPGEAADNRPARDWRASTSSTYSTSAGAGEHERQPSESPGSSTSARRG